MSLAAKIPLIIEHIKANEQKLQDNQTIFSILEGNILDSIHRAIEKQLSGKSQDISKQRVPPINVLRKVVDKQTAIYSDSPARETKVESDQTILGSYEESLSIDDQFNTVNESYNGYKYGVEEIFYNKSKGDIDVRTIPNTGFLPYCDDDADKLKVTVMIKFMGEYISSAGANPEKKQIYYLYSDEEFLIINCEGSVLTSMMNELELDGVNPYGVIPFSYISKSKFLCIPMTDSDQIAMSILVPLLMTELNFGMMFLANPIIYGINMEVDNLNVSPMAFWNIKKDGETDGEAKIDVLRPDMNIPDQAKWIMEQLAIWLETKNIKASHLVNIGADTIASGIALIIREMDTTEDRKKQAKAFKKFETDFWSRFKIIHNYLANANMLPNNTKLSEDFAPTVVFNINNAIETKNDIYSRATAAYQSGAVSRETTIREYYPEWTDEQVNAELAREVIKVEAKTDGEL